jgi:polysaccharide export outer membrane protein
MILSTPNLQARMHPAPQPRGGSNHFNHSFGRRYGQVARVLVALVFFAGSAWAQFTGPAPDLTATVNHSLVPTTDPAILYPGAREIVLGQGDLLAIHIYGMVDYAPVGRVAVDGSIQLPLIGGVPVDGLTIHQAEDLIARRLSDAGMYRSPQVSIQVTESPNQIVTLAGEMHGVFPVTTGKRLMDALSAAGGLPATASHTIVIQRPGVSEPIVVALGTDPSRSNLANVPVYPRDTIIVSRIGLIYILGAFKNQIAVPIQQNSPLTLLQAAAVGGGAGFEGKLDDLRIIRTTGVTRSVVHVNIKKVLAGKDPDPILQADDIVFLPSNAMKAAIKSGGISTLLGIASVAVYSTRL